MWLLSVDKRSNDCLEIPNGYNSTVLVIPYFLFKSSETHERQISDPSPPLPEPPDF